MVPDVAAVRPYRAPPLRGIPILFEHDAGRLSMPFAQVVISIVFALILIPSFAAVFYITRHLNTR